MLLRKGRGRLIWAGRVEPEDPIRIKQGQIAAGLILTGFFLFLLVGLPLRLGGFDPSNSHWITNIGGSIIGVSLMPLLIDLLGVEVDAVFEHGVSNSSAPLHRTLTRRGFQPFDEITAIAVTWDRESGKEVLILFSGKERKIRIRPFYDSYHDDFYPFLKDTFKARCPGAKWVYVPFTDALSKRFMTWKEARAAFRERRARLPPT
jgi:hypothetical protein